MITPIATLNQTIEGLNRIATAHTQINTFYFGDAWEFATSGTTTYPAMVVSLDNGNFQRQVTELKMSIYLMDLVRKGESNETEVLSDMISIGKDIRSEIGYDAQINGWTWNVRNPDSIGFESFTEKFDDMVTGIKMTVVFQLVSPDDTCQIPQGNITRF
jgi:hypothetical protein